MYVDKYEFGYRFYCKNQCMEYFQFILKELGKTDNLFIIYGVENRGYTKFGIVVWNLQRFMLIFGFFIIFIKICMYKKPYVNC